MQVMRITLVIIFFIVCCFTGVVFALLSSHSISANTLFGHAAPLPQNVNYPAIPSRIRIPSLSVDADVESVGLDNQGLMDVPRSASDTAWFAPGPKPGETGNAVIDGHVDTAMGKPAVFALLKRMRPGNLIIVSDSRHTLFFFRVTRIASLPTDNFPVQSVFGSSALANLNLITCDGIWNMQQKSYNRRLVVFSTLIQRK